MMLKNSSHHSQKRHNQYKPSQASTNQAIDSLSLSELQAQLHTSLEGLSQTDAQNRLTQYGLNELPEDTTRPWQQFLSHFWGPIPWMIEVAAILSAVVRDWPDLAIILVLLIVNSLVGFWEEYQAGNAIADLKAQLALKARVKRSRTWQVIPTRELVPGDIIRLRIGDIVPADARLLAEDAVDVDQSALTGESLPVTKGQGDAVYSGSILKRGETNALVYATGMETYFGQTARLVESTHHVSHFQKAVLKIGDYLIAIALLLIALILVVALFRNDSLVDTLKFALVLTVASIPVAMPTVLSVTMAVGAGRLAKKQAIVSRLAAIEELAGIDVLCSDKTGTLTLNQLTIGEPFCASGIPADELIQWAALASRLEDQDPIDQVVIAALPNPEILKSYQVQQFLPFDPVSKRTEATLQQNTHQQDTHQQGTQPTFRVTKGAPQVILALSANAEGIQAEVEQAIASFAHRGFRSLGVAKTDEQGQWQFLGVLPLYDPPRSDAQTTLEEMGDMGVQVKMVTGDQVAIAQEISQQLGLGRNILNANLFATTEHHETGQIADAIQQADGFAQVFPEHKYHIVDVLQQHGHIVGMTGDGVNDAPALKKADAGIAVSGATDAARAAADIVLLSPGLSVIVDAIRESRRIFQRMNHYAIYRITETIRVLTFMTLSILVFDFYPVTAIMIVLLALLNDGAILSIAYDRTRYAQHPETWNMPVVLGLATVLGLTGVVESFGLFYLGQRVLALSPDLLQTLIYLKLSVAGHLTVFVTRTRGPFWSLKPAPILLFAVLGTQAIATLIAVYGIFMTPLGWGWALLVWGYALIWFLIEDWIKVQSYRLFDIHHPVMGVRRHVKHWIGQHTRNH
jgi:H+-transporting ATPase